MRDSLGAQMVALLERDLITLNSDVAPKVAEDIRDRALQNSRNGHAFGNDEYKKTYAPSTIVQRRRGGYQVSHVDLRRSKKRIERMQVRKPINADTGAVIKWDDANDGALFRKHHEGQGKLPTRRIFPESPASVPVDIHTKAYNLAREVLNGN